jgi:pyocin large subunit-like protein
MPTASRQNINHRTWHIYDDFFEQSQKAGLPTKIGPDGTIRVYDPGSNTFGAFNSDGTTKTFFKPTNPGYFDNQPAILLPPSVP